MMIITFLCGVACVGFWIYSSISFTQNCSGHLERAANANTIELAEKELSVALKYLEKEKITSGSTHIFYATPDNDINYWYTNIKSAYEELKSIPKTSSLQERTNVLMKLRESLMGHSKNGDHVILPPRISIYPNQTVIFIGSLLFLFLSSIAFKKIK